MFWVISVYFNIRNTLPKSGTFLLGHPVYIYIYIYIYIHLTQILCILTQVPLLTLWAVRPVQSLSACTRVTFTFTFSFYISAVNCWQLCCNTDALYHLLIQRRQHCHMFIVHLSDHRGQKDVTYQLLVNDKKKTLRLFLTVDIYHFIVGSLVT